MRRVWITAVIQVGLAGLVVLWGTVTVPWLSHGGDTGTVWLWWLLSMPAGCAVALVRVSAMADMERTAARPVARMDTVVIGSLLVWSGLCFTVALTVIGLSAVVPLTLAQLAWWTALGVIGGVVLGPRRSWTVPLTYLLVLAVWGQSLKQVPGWRWAALPFAEPGLSTVAVGGGVLVGALGLMTTWRRVGRGEG